MIGGTKRMIARCIDRMGRGACGDCAARNPCRFPVRNFLGLADRAGPGGRRVSPSGEHPFLAMLGRIAAALDGGRTPRETPFRRELERRLEPMLGSGPVRIGGIAREMGLSRQTLYRRLKAEGTSFEKVLDALRRRLGLRLIREEKISVKEAAWRLGFSDPAAFSRAYKRWTGKSPRGPRQSG